MCFKTGLSEEGIITLIAFNLFIACAVFRVPNSATLTLYTTVVVAPFVSRENIAESAVVLTSYNSQYILSLADPQLVTEEWCDFLDVIEV